MRRRFSLSTMALAACLATQACTFIGAGMGSTIPSYETVKEAPQRPPVERKDGTYWWAGALVGLVVDAAVITALASSIGSGTESSGSSNADGGGGCFLCQ